MAHSTSTAFIAQLLWLLLFLCGIPSLTVDLHVDCAELEWEALVHFKDDIENLSRRADQSLLDPHHLEWLSRLSFLKYLNLGGLGFSYEYKAMIQTLNSLPSLEELHLHNCGLSSADLNISFVNFTSLRVLDLSDNDLNCTLPHWVFNLKNLVHLDLSGSNLCGQFPDGIVDSLEHLDLSDNGIGGRLSSNLGKLCNLRNLKLSHNAISGEITGFVNTLSACSNNSLETLDLGSNAFMGNLPDTLGYIKSLKVLQLQNNSF
ncbi:hypothetical protein FEM48_Zijuj09G0216400 [Ziziphus jujuba var. spinosa]|uniref:Uncharacterized protein n=1 Tax=Ziziphus jujuba var. spinosa TaxID=714518 RepID=A0A978UVG4_ZIZJJ|nr:hypothetical protein FEM48_Zijuj09G0216400 [Ziziphus jujuba var. spinosa]